MKKEDNMYSLSKKQYNPYVGCKHNCIYCITSFQRQLKRQKKRCTNCYLFIPHEHPNRLNMSLPNTQGLEFIFTCSNGDIAFCSKEYKYRILERIEKSSNKTFLLQSKDSKKAFENIKFPKNVILGITLETDRDDIYKGISEAPLPSKRYKDFLNIEHDKKMVTVEPAIDFNMENLVNYIKSLNPIMVWVGYDSKNNYLPEPELAKVEELIKRLEEFTIVIRKTIRKAWWE